MFRMTMIPVLMALAIPIYQESQTRDQESQLRSTLLTIRGAFHQYVFDKKRAPQTLQDLVGEGYLKSVPIDPITGSNKSWVAVMEDTQNAVDKVQPGIRDVHSGSNSKSVAGTPYSLW